MPKYVKCPRCDLNWMLEGEEYCDVCKAELKLEGGISLLEEEDEDNLCPYCGVNYLEPGEKLCAECREKKQAKRLIEEDDEEDSKSVDDEDSIEVSFSDVENEEEEEEWVDSTDIHYDEENFSDFGVEDDMMLDDVDLEEEEE